VTDPVVYSGPDVMNHFYDHVIRESDIINTIIKDNKDMLVMTDDQRTDYDTATICGSCSGEFTRNNPKVRHHCHVSGNFLNAVCNNCNLQLKMPNRKRKYHTGMKNKIAKKTADHDDDNDNDEYFLPIVFHNLKCYDAHFIIKHFKKQYTACPKTSTDDIKYDDIQVIPLNNEKYLSFQIKQLRFIDSYQCLSASLEDLVSLLLKSGRDKFIHTTKHLGDHDSVFSKGIYPYSYMTRCEKFAGTQLPPIEAFVDKLNDENVDERNYERAKTIWSHFGIKTMQDYHYFIVFENFQNTIFQEHGLYCLHFITLPYAICERYYRHSCINARPRLLLLLGLGLILLLSVFDVSG